MGELLFPGYERYARRISARELATFLKVGSSLASTLNLAEVLQIAIESASSLLGLNTGAIYTLENDLLYLGATTPPLPADLPDELLFARLGDHPHIKETVEGKAPVYIKDAREGQLSPAERVVVEARHLVSVLYFPLLLKNQAIGVFIVGTTQKTHKFSAKEIDLCYILSFQVAMAVANAVLYQHTQQAIQALSQAYDATLEGWSRVLDMRDHGTDEHTRRVADMTVVLARRMGIPEGDLEHIRRGALLHDIGKMGVPDTIVQKTSQLTKSEQAIMRTHPEKAFQILSQISYLLPDIDIPYCHHERWDGKGYPRRLKGEDIPLSARLFAVVDVYDALVSDRSYRKGWKREKALLYIQKQSGKHFYPQAVEAFLEMMTNESSGYSDRS